MASTGRKDRAARDPQIELHPDAWDRFTDFVKRIAKAGPQHRPRKLASQNSVQKPDRPKRPNK